MQENVYAVAGGKGGVGKTSVTANTGIVLQEQGYDVAAVDADLCMTNLGELFDISADQGIHHILSGNATVDSVLVEGPAGIDIVPGTEGLHEVGSADPANLRRAVEPLCESHDIVLVDTGAGVSHQNLVALGLADAAVLVTTPSELAATDVEKTMQMVDRVNGTVAGLVVTRVGDDADREQATEIAADLGLDILSLVPTYDEPGAQEPRYRNAQTSPAGAEYERLGTALSVYHQTGDAAAAAGRAANKRNLDEPEADSEESEGFLSSLSSLR